MNICKTSTISKQIKACKVTFFFAFQSISTFFSYLNLVHLHGWYTANFRKELSTREKFILCNLVEKEERGASEERRIWLKPSDTRNNVRTKKNCWPSTSPADGSISSRRIFFLNPCFYQTKKPSHFLLSLFSLKNFQIFQKILGFGISLLLCPR